MVICQDVSTDTNVNCHTILILKARSFVVIQLAKTVTDQALGEVGLEVPGMTEDDACTRGWMIMELTVRGLIGVCDQFRSHVLPKI